MIGLGIGLFKMRETRSRRREKCYQYREGRKERNVREGQKEIRNTYLVVHNQTRHHLCNLKIRNVFPYTTPIPRSKRQQRILHLPLHALIRLNPPFWSPIVGVRAECTVVAMSGPRRHANYCSGRKEMVEDGSAGGRDDTFVGETEGGADGRLL